MVPTRVVVNGALGRMGQEVARAVLADKELRFVGAVEANASQPYLPVPDYPDLIPFASNLGTLIEKTCPDVVVDFTRASVAMEASRIALPLKVSMVIGSTGLSEEDLNEMRQLCESHGVGAVVAANFSLGAVLLMHLAQIAARFFANAEIIEMHHDKKLDAPSGTALATARLMTEARGSRFEYPSTEKEVLPKTRGGEVSGVAIHSVRLPGVMAAQEVLFGGKGQTLLLRHDATSRESYMPGVLLAVKEVVKTSGLVVGLDKLMGL
jgi:4-hydroxy-tetrahydrodipicolinate reductase